MKNVKFVGVIIICVVLTACSGSKKSDSSGKITKDAVVGYYTGIDEFNQWSCNIDQDGTGYELAIFRNNSIQIAIPFTWTLQNNEISFTFNSNEVSIEGDVESEVSQAIITSAMAGYSESRDCSVLNKEGTIVINGDGLYPSYEQVTVQ